jgi:hypothetical protein
LVQEHQQISSDNTTADPSTISLLHDPDDGQIIRLIQQSITAPHDHKSSAGTQRKISTHLSYIFTCANQSPRQLINCGASGGLV